MTPNPPVSPLKVLSTDDYVRNRLAPTIFHTDYLHLTDLAALVGEMAPRVHGRVFDFGCGGAPYRQLFGHCPEYVAADFEAGPAVNRVLGSDGMTNETGASYDFVLSTQVLEHVRNPGSYLQECHRILRRGGEILLTTHGMVEEHGCPYDFQRWTPNGLEELFRTAGFQVIESGKLTTEIRGIVQLLNQFAHHLRYQPNRVKHLLLSVVRNAYVKVCMPLLNKFANAFAEQAVVKGPSDARIYTAVFVHARKSG